MRQWWLVLIGLLAGCVRLSVPTPAVHEFQLSYPAPAESRAPLPVVLEVGPIDVDAVYDREPIVYRQDAYSTATYVDSRWSANPGKMVADLLVRDMSAAGSYRAVQRAPGLLPSDYRLSGNLVEIEERATSHGCAAHLALRVVLSRTRGAGRTTALLQRTYEGQQASACAHPAGLAAAMSEALAGISARLQRDIYETIAADAAGSARSP